MARESYVRQVEREVERNSRKIVVKFRDYIRAPADSSGLRSLPRMAIAQWDEISTFFGGLSVEPLFSEERLQKLEARIARAVRIDPAYKPRNFRNYYQVATARRINAEDVVRMLLPWAAVETAYLPPSPGEPPVTPDDEFYSDQQGYLNQQPEGIDARYAWGFPGGDGTGQALVDIEQGWIRDHEDLKGHGISVIYGDDTSSGHGARVLGVIAAEDNGLGCIGIVPKLASIKCANQFNNGSFSTDEPICEALNHLSAGDVLLLEAQTGWFWGYEMLPVEIEPVVFDMIRLATALGIVVVECAGNTGINLDGVVDPYGKHVLNGSDEFDSGAIVVGAATSTVPHVRKGRPGAPGAPSNYGHRVDCYAWGENVRTLAAPPGLYTPTFHGTSAAGAIVAGAALAVQGLASQPPGSKLLPWQLRHILKTNGTASADPAQDLIGVMPDLRKIIDENVLNLAPDIFVRDFVGDTGDRHNDAISASPDVIVRQDVLADPQSQYGEGSGTEDSATLGSEAVSGKPNYLYVRMRNRGGTPATNAKIVAYWSPPSTLVSPHLWNFIGSTTISQVPPGNLLTVSDHITWNSVPATGHYCFVALIGSDQDPLPLLPSCLATPADCIDWEQFVRLIRENNNVTWRNFDVVSSVPPLSTSFAEYVVLPFEAAGAHDSSRNMHVEIFGRLPRGAKLLLDMPTEFARALRLQNLSDGGVEIARVVLNPCGRTTFPTISFPARVRVALRLLVSIPENLRRWPFEVFARQLYEGQEVGRITWRLMEPRFAVRTPERQ